jgi:hypothetical protein
LNIYGSFSETIVFVFAFVADFGFAVFAFSSFAGFLFGETRSALLTDDEDVSGRMP